MELIQLESSNISNKDSMQSTNGCSFSIVIILRILSALHEKGKAKRTNLAGMTGLNYKQCVKYVNLLLLLGWTRIVFDDGNHVTITDKGIEIIERLATFTSDI